jgi:cytochrome b561
MSSDHSVTDAGGDTTMPLKYDRMLVVLHWILALGLIFQLGLGLWMEDIPKDQIGRAHV